MKKEKDYVQDLTEIRSMMERSSKFLSLSGMAGVMAGIYALAGAYIAYRYFDFNPGHTYDSTLQSGRLTTDLLQIMVLAAVVLVLAVATAAVLSYRKAARRSEKLWNPTAKRLLANMAVPLIAGGLLILILLFKGLIGLVAPVSLIFYGLALYNASKFTYEDLRTLGLIEVALGLIGAYFVGYGLLLWALGFGVFHIIYGILMYYRYDR